MNTADLDPVRQQVELLRWLVKRKAELRELETAARAAVEDVMGDAEVGLLDDEPAIRWPHYKERRFDQKAFGEAYPDLLEEFRTARGKRKFEVIED